MNDILPNPETLQEQFPDSLPLADGESDGLAVASDSESGQQPRLPGEVEILSPSVHLRCRRGLAHA